MAEELKGLIEKINQEGIKAAQEKAKAIEEEAAKKAQALLEKAERQAKDLIAGAKDTIARNEASSRALLKQAGRDLLISVRKEISSMLNRLIEAHVKAAMGPDDMARIITGLIKDMACGSESDIVISMKKEDAEKLEKTFFAALKDELKKGITLKDSGDMRGGFVISFDRGASHYDFTDKALAEYIGLTLQPRLAGILREAAEK